MVAKDYTSSVFINCPFDKEYLPIRNAIVFAVYDCGFIPRCALEESDGGNVRFEKIQRIITECKYGIHDICRTEADLQTGLPRFNMPFELGLFLGAKRYGNIEQKNKICLIFDRESYRYQRFISDIAGQDIRSHSNDPETTIGLVSEWLRTASRRRSIPGGNAITGRFQDFLKDYPAICKNAKLELNEVVYNDFSGFVSDWLRETDMPTGKERP